MCLFLVRPAVKNSMCPVSKYSESMELNGVKLFEFCSVIVDIYVESPKYKTKRGLKVGDSIEKVQRLYGKPAVAFSGDDFVEYKFCCKDMNGELEINYYRGLKSVDVDTKAG